MERIVKSIAKRDIIRINAFSCFHVPEVPYYFFSMLCLGSVKLMKVTGSLLNISSAITTS